MAADLSLRGYELVKTCVRTYGAVEVTLKVYRVREGMCVVQGVCDGCDGYLQALETPVSIERALNHVAMFVANQVAQEQQREALLSRTPEIADAINAILRKYNVRILGDGEGTLYLEPEYECLKFGDD